MIQLIVTFLKAFPAIAKVGGKAFDFYREARAREVYETKLSNIDSAVNAHLSGVPNEDDAGSKNNDGKAGLSERSTDGTGVDEGSTQGDSQT
mgnify:CR=1 FL=1